MSNFTFAHSYFYSSCLGRWSFHPLPSLWWFLPHYQLLLAVTFSFFSVLITSLQILTTPDWLSQHKITCTPTKTLTLHLFTSSLSFSLPPNSYKRWNIHCHSHPSQFLRHSSRYRSLNLLFCWNCSHSSTLLPQLHHLITFFSKSILLICMELIT